MQRRQLRTGMDQILPNPLLVSTHGRLATSHHMTAKEKVKLNAHRINCRNRSNLSRCQSHQSTAF